MDWCSAVTAVIGMMPSWQRVCPNDGSAVIPVTREKIAVLRGKSVLANTRKQRLRQEGQIAHGKVLSKRLRWNVMVTGLFTLLVVADRSSLSQIQLNV